MLRCKVCKVPLSGFLGKISKLVLKVNSSVSDSGVCNKCAGQAMSKKKGVTPDQLKGGRYQCTLCGRMIHEEHSLEHIKAEEYLIELIRKDHSHWKDKDPTCQDCVDYYRRLVKETEI